MLSDLEALAVSAIKQPVLNGDTLQDRALPLALRQKLQEVVDGAVTVSKHTTVIGIPGGNTVCIPNQYYRFASELYSFATELKKYLDVLDLLRSDHSDGLNGTAAQIKSYLGSAQLPVALTPRDIELFSRFLSSDQPEGRLEGKRPINSDGSLRMSSDCFGSVILTRINTPNASSSILGDIIYSLSQHDPVYRDVVSFYSESESSALSPEARVPLPKPFLLLAGISGTGKTRFVREQARLSDAAQRNFHLEPVRPDWHEPSDLLGYVSRISKPERFVATPLLAFMAKAWRETPCDIEPEGFRVDDLNAVPTYWACLDEMNLAPVEQYFADYLVVVETRSWIENLYSCAPILDIPKLGLDDDGLSTLCKDLGFGPNDSLWHHFRNNGMPLPPNLVLAGTVNMDETTHGFSRKVIDRAFTIDFGEFFPNNFEEYFSPATSPVTLTFPRWSRAQKDELANVEADPDGSKSVAFLELMNQQLEGTPFQLAFRALNELLVAVLAFEPRTDKELAAVWDDFLMTKLLPRMEGDAERLDFTESGKSLLTAVAATVNRQLGALLGADAADQLRPDLLRRRGTAPVEIPLRTPRALARMQARLEKHNFTSFWP